MNFEWDEDKDKINRSKHKLPLEAGITVFDDPHCIDFQDSRETYDEERYVSIGRDYKTQILYVAYTMKGHYTTRLISVRKATKQECRLYDSQW
ncbi:hypothetical protein MNBD_GAMMA07-1009 [hydrothermal vent metagenome]|uniref:COGs COG2929 n=1 Tax=hydrothermal vent metagenome TaxID=652676 RepID=A0A3B0WX05_9ZZZZ